MGVDLLCCVYLRVLNYSSVEQALVGTHSLSDRAVTWARALPGSCMPLERSHRDSAKFRLDCFRE